MGTSTISMAISNSYVKLPEGRYPAQKKKNSWLVDNPIDTKRPKD